MQYYSVIFLAVLAVNFALFNGELTDSRTLRESVVQDGVKHYVYIFNFFLSNGCDFVTILRFLFCLATVTHKVGFMSSHLKQTSENLHCPGISLLYRKLTPEF